jgi:diaminopimelate epimerase
VAAIELTRVDGLGNDFFLIDRIAAETEDSESTLDLLREQAARLCERSGGVDGLLIVGPPWTPDGIASMLVINRDGSRPEMCGNGLRCVALWLGHRRGLRKVPIDTDAGLRRCEVVNMAPDGRHGEVLIDMGPARDLGEVQPTAASGLTFRAISVGNPHAVAFVSAQDDPEALARELGPRVETDPVFPERTNVELCRVEPDGSLTLCVWERGCGITRACGTGASATAAAAVLEGLARRAVPIQVRLPGGDLRIRVPEDPDHGIEMIGPARIGHTEQASLEAP